MTDKRMTTEELNGEWRSLAKQERDNATVWEARAQLAGTVAMKFAQQADDANRALEILHVTYPAEVIAALDVVQKARDAATLHAEEGSKDE